MNFADPHQLSVFFDVHRDLPREAPGSRACTLRALGELREAVPLEPRQVVDLGCGPGRQTLDLAAVLPHACFVAIDLHLDFLRALSRQAQQESAAARVLAVCGDMGRVPLPRGWADLVWCEGAAYNIGVGPALEVWWHLLRPGGACAFTEAVWLRDDRPAAARQLWAEYPAMGDVDGVRTLVKRAGYRLLGDFLLPAAAWWDDYYRPMEARLHRLEAIYRDDPVALGVLDLSRREIDVYRRHGDAYGYAFFMAHKPPEAVKEAAGP